ncbi:magnesium transporter [Pseudomonas sp.]|uniref:magnesium transporter n=1 Tax=Pseudomonas sp. TaxID=306 RepID=UPI00272DB2B2|nr:magnesium transporter [Pseudomonas sp.]
MYEVDTQTLNEAVAGQDVTRLKAALASMRPADIAEFLESMQPREALALLKQMTNARRSEVFGHLPAHLQIRLVGQMEQRSLATLLAHMDPDERADLFNLLDSPLQQEILQSLAHREQEDLRLLAGFPAHSAGAIMTSDFAALTPELSASEALAQIRRSNSAPESVLEVYVLDDEGRLQGRLSLGELVLADPAAEIRKLMTLDVVSVTVETPQEEVARLVARYDLVALPVVDSEQRLVGVVTHDDAMDVAEAEATEDIHKGATIGKLEGGLRGASLPLLYRKRIGWLVLLVFANVFSGAGIAYFEDTIAAYVALVFFLPLLVDSGGNAGSQSATLMVRGLATGEVRIGDWSRLLGRELLVACGLGLTMALAVSGLGFWRGGSEIALVVSLSMIAIVIMGSVVGMCMPFMLNRFGVDPATASAPLVTSVADACGVVIYFGIATALLTMG